MQATPLHPPELNSLMAGPDKTKVCRGVGSGQIYSLQNAGRRRSGMEMEEDTGAGHLVLRLRGGMQTSVRTFTHRWRALRVEEGEKPLFYVWSGRAPAGNRDSGFTPGNSRGANPASSLVDSGQVTRPYSHDATWEPGGKTFSRVSRTFPPAYCGGQRRIRTSADGPGNSYKRQRI